MKFNLSWNFSPLLTPNSAESEKWGAAEGEREEVHDDRTERSLYWRVLLGTGCTQVKAKIDMGFRIAT